MAGIGFELRKIYKKKTLFSAVTGTLYATMVVMGPAVIFILALLLIHVILRLNSATLAETDFFVSSFTYSFLIALLVSTPVSNVLSRYISDKIFEHRYEDISASLLGSITLITAVCGSIAAVLCYLLYTKDGVELSLLIPYYMLCILAGNMYNLMNYVSALKEYLRVTFSFVAGFGLGAVIFLILYYGFRADILNAVYYGVVIAVLFIDMFLIRECLRFFGKPGEKSFEYLQYFNKYPQLAIAGMAYMLGVFLTNLAYWYSSDFQLRVGIFRTAPLYDMAIFLALIINFPALIIFVVKIETEFYEANVKYLSALNKGSYMMIESEKEAMENTLKLQLFFVYNTQLMITVFLICAIGVIFPYLGLASVTINMFMILGMGVYCTLCMYFTIVMLYYFSDYVSACIGACTFLGIEILAILICGYLKEYFYPLPLLIAGICGWCISFFLLRRRIKNLNRYLLSK